MEIVTWTVIFLKIFVTTVLCVFPVFFLLDFYKLKILKKRRRWSCVQQPSYWEAFPGDFPHQFQRQYLQLLNVLKVPQFSATDLGQIYTNTHIWVRASPAEGLVEHTRALVMKLSMLVVLEFPPGRIVSWLHRTYAVYFERLLKWFGLRVDVICRLPCCCWGQWMERR